LETMAFPATARLACNATRTRLILESIVGDVVVGKERYVENLLLRAKNVVAMLTRIVL
jgi:hypothetical protein